MTSPYAAGPCAPACEPLATPQAKVPPDPGHGFAQWDDGRCPECRSGTLVAWVNGVAYRHCSYVSCDWGLRSDVIVATTASDAGAPSATSDGAGQSHPTPGEKT